MEGADWGLIREMERSLGKRQAKGIERKAELLKATQDEEDIKEMASCSESKPGINMKMSVNGTERAALTCSPSTLHNALSQHGARPTTLGITGLRILRSSK
jgi:hypothetical protein